MTAATACRTCGTEPLENARFCHSCGAPVAAQTPAEYKQVTVLFADVVHSMDIAAAVGPERLREIMAELVNRCTVVVKRYGGTVDKFTGDGIMAVFGAPIALEDHAVRACFAALGIQEQAQQLALDVQREDGAAFSVRVGLNSGQVIAGEIGSSAPGYTAVGEHVGLAQRMESTAPPGEVMLSESTARLVERSAVLGEPEMVHVKGSERPVPARRLLGMETSHVAVGPGESKLVGRRWEMSAAEGILERSIEGNGAVVALVGPPGIGKSRMVREIAATAADRGVEIFWAFCESHTSDIPFQVATQLVRAVVGLPALDEESVRARLREGFEDADEDDLMLFEDLLGIRDPDIALPNVDPDARRRRLSALVKAATVAREAPAIYIVEDAHWIDDVSDSILADFMTVIPQAHAMVLLTYRQEFSGALARIAGAQTLTLAPLSVSESSALASELLGSDPSVGELAKTIAARAAGNPFFAEEIVRDLSERGVLCGQRGAYVCRPDVAEISVPATLHATISARIDRLVPKAKRTLCAAAVIGTRFDADLLVSLGIDAVFEDLLEAELINQLKFTLPAEYAFRHPLIRTVAYESQLKADRATLHRQLAVAVQQQNPEQADENAALIAEHLEAAGDLQAAYGWHMRAGAWSMNRDIAAAYVSWDRARHIADMMPEGEPSRLQMRIAPRTLMCGHGFRAHVQIAEAQFEELRELCEIAGDKASLAIAMAGLIGDHMVQGRLREATQLAAEHIVLIESIADPALIVGLSVTSIAINVTVGDIEEVLRVSQLVIDLAGGDSAMGNFILGNPLPTAFGTRSIARWALGQSGWREDFDRAVAMVKDADPMSQSVVTAYTYSMAIGNRVLLADERALRAIGDALSNAERWADDLALGFARWAKAIALLDCDREDAKHGLELLEQVREMAVEGRFYLSHIPLLDVWIGHARASCGDRDGALPLMRKGLDQLCVDGQFIYCVGATPLLVEALLEGATVADLEEAQAAVNRLAATPNVVGLAITDVTLLGLRARLARARGDDTSRELAEQYLAMSKALGFEGHIAMAKAMT